MSETAEDFLNLCDEAVEDLEKMRELDVSARVLYNRLYYAVFYSAKAALMSEGIETKTHRGTASKAYQVLYDKKQVIDKETAIILQRIQEKRDMADYEVEINFDTEDFEEDYEKAQQFISKMKEVVKSDE